MRARPRTPIAMFPEPDRVQGKLTAERPLCVSLSARAALEMPQASERLAAAMCSRAHARAKCGPPTCGARDSGALALLQFSIYAGAPPSLALFLSKNRGSQRSGPRLRLVAPLFLGAARASARGEKPTGAVGRPRGGAVTHRRSHAAS